MYVQLKIKSYERIILKISSEIKLDGLRICEISLVGGEGLWCPVGC